jgi:hypothetical protein
VTKGAHLQLGLPGDAVDGRNQASEVQIDFGSFNRCFVGLDLSFGGFHGGYGGEVILHRIVEILLAAACSFASGV